MEKPMQENTALLHAQRNKKAIAALQAQMSAVFEELEALKDRPTTCACLKVVEGIGERLDALEGREVNLDPIIVMLESISEQLSSQPIGEETREFVMSEVLEGESFEEAYQRLLAKHNELMGLVMLNQATADQARAHTRLAAKLFRYVGS